MAAELGPVLDAATLARNLDDPMWRLSNLYKIIIKGDDDGEDGLVVTFKPNRAQRRLLARLWYRNIILKARQLGFTTLICVLWLDTALFSKDPIRCGIIAQDKEAAESIFRTKVKFAYDQLSPELRASFPLKKQTAAELEFAHNGASIRVATSMRSGTIHRLHISEFGKICAKYPDKAAEVVTGSIPAVPQSGMLVIESTAEGQDGEFYTMTQRAIAVSQQLASGALSALTPKHYRFHFFAWWEDPSYTLHDPSVVFTEADEEYFLQVEARVGRKLTDDQWTWYVTTRDNDFSGDAPRMWQEYPSYPEEAFQVSTQGCWYATQVARARVDGRIRPRLPIESAPVFTFWDIGRGDMTTIWFMQKIGPDHRFILYYEATGEDLKHYAKYLQDRGFIFGKHFLPHEANYRRIGKDVDTNQTIKEMLEELLPGQTFEVVPRVSNISAGIQATRASFASSWFSEEGCRTGIARLSSYRKRWDPTNARFTEEPLHNDDSHGADGYRQFGQVLEAGEKFAVGAAISRPGRKGVARRASGMGV